MRIPITMCHGTTWQPLPRKTRHTANRLTAERFEIYFQIASELGFQSISYEHLAGWMNGASNLPERPKDFAYTSTTWSRIAEREVNKRYRFGRLWIIGTHYNTDEGEMRYADLVGALGEDEADGGPPYEARYITEDSDPYRLPSMELEHLIFGFEAFRAYLQGGIASSLCSSQ